MKILVPLAALLLLAPICVAQQKPAPPKVAMHSVRAMAALAPNQHGNVLGWGASPDSTVSTPGTVAVYKQVGPCPASGPLLNPVTLTTSAPPAGPFTDTAVVAGQANCYAIAAEIGGLVSNQSNLLQLVTPIFSPTALTGTAY